MEQEVSANGHDSNSTWHSLLSAISAGVRSGSSILFSSDAFSKLYDEHRIVSGHTASDTLLSCYQYFKLLLRTNHDENVALYLMEAIRTIITVDCMYELLATSCHLYFAFHITYHSSVPEWTISRRVAFLHSPCYS